MTGPYLALETAYRDRGARGRELAASGTAVIGMVGADVPRALVAAAGALPFRMHGDCVSEDAIELIGRAVDSPVLATLTAILNGDYDHLAGILIAHDCQASVRLFYVLRELARAGRLPMPVHFVDLVHLDREPSLRFNRAQLAAAANELGRWTGTPATADSLRRAMTATATVTEQLLRIDALRRQDPPAITGVEAFWAYGVADTLPADAAVELLGTVKGHGTEGPPAERLFFTGSSPDGDAIYRRIEQHDVVIVGEDHDRGGLLLSVRPATPSADDGLEELYEALALALLRAAPAAATSTSRDRGRATSAAISTSHATALLSVVREHDDAAAWDFPRQAAEAGVPSALLARQPALPAEVVLAEALVALRGAA